MELVLSKKLAERRMWPAIDLPASGTRKEELLLGVEGARKVGMLRRDLASRDPVQAMESLLAAMKKFPTNAQFLAAFGSGGQMAPNPSRDRQATTTQAMHSPSGGMPALGSQASKFASWHLDELPQDRNILPLTSLQKHWHPLSDPLGGSS